jgi:serine/threonine protein kinase
MGADLAISGLLASPMTALTPPRGQSDGRMFMAMELLDGPSLAELISRGERFPLDQCLHVMEQLAQVVEEIHAKGVLHRDLKPENVIVIERDGDPHFVKLLDFGLARTQSLTRLTQSGIIVGALSYLPPEQITEQRFNDASDIYSLGVIFYELLTGQPAFPGSTLVDVIKQILDIDPVPPSRYRKEIPPEPEALVIAMMSKRPQHRPDDGSVRQALKALV